MAKRNIFSTKTIKSTTNKTDELIGKINHDMREVIFLRIPQSHKKLLKQYALDHNTTMADLMRDCIQKILES